MATTNDSKIIVKQGETITHISLFEDESGTAQDLTDWTGRLQVRSQADDTGTALYEVTDYAFTDSGLASVDVAPTITPGVYVYDERFVDGDGDVIFTDTNLFIVQQPVSKV